MRLQNGEEVSFGSFVLVDGYVRYGRAPGDQQIEWIRGVRVDPKTGVPLANDRRGIIIPRETAVGWEIEGKNSRLPKEQPAWPDEAVG
jgi:hypothetical protein